MSFWTSWSTGLIAAGFLLGYLFVRGVNALDAHWARKERAERELASVLQRVRDQAIEEGYIER